MFSEGYSTWCVCLIVVSYSRTTGYNSFRIMQTFPETTACEKYAVKTSEKADIRNRHWFTQPVLLALCTLEAKRSHNERHKLTPACYLLV